MPDRKEYKRTETYHLIGVPTDNSRFVTYEADTEGALTSEIKIANREFVGMHDWPVVIQITIEAVEPERKA